MTHAEADALPMAQARATEPWLDMTEHAAEAFKRLADKRNRPDAVLRVRVAPDHTCGDYKYAMGIEPGARADDVTLEFHGMSVIVDSGSVELLRHHRLQRCADRRRFPDRQSEREVVVWVRPVVHDQRPSGGEPTRRSGRAVGPEASKASRRPRWRLCVQPRYSSSGSWPTACPIRLV